MRTTVLIPSLVFLLSACGTMRETASVKDDVYDIPDRKALAAAMAARDQEQAAQQQDEYYDPQELGNSGSDRDYYDMTYNDPYYYNYGRFGFGMGVGGFGPGYGMDVSYGWPTSFGSVSMVYGIGNGYNPYWGNSWMSGYGYDPYGYYGYGNYGYGYGGYGMGYGSYQGLWGGVYAPPGSGYVYSGRDGYSSRAVYGHRPSMSAGAGASGQAAPTLRMYRGPAGLLQPDGQPRRSDTERNARARNGRTITVPRSGTENRNSSSESRPSRNWSNPGNDSPSRSGGDSGGRINSPRPR